MKNKTTEQFAHTKLTPLKLPQKEALTFEQRIIEADEQLLQPSVNYIWRKPPPKPNGDEKPAYERIKCNDLIFVFKYDDSKPKMLHISARHSTTTDDAIQLFFTQDAVWHEERNRYENHSPTHGLYWFWRDVKKKVVMVISCFKCERTASG